MKRWLCLLVACCFVVCSADTLCAQQRAQAAAQGPPNIVLIMADDLGWTDLGCRGSRYYETPHIDRLAEQGLTFTSFYVCQNCAPTRAALISGQYAPRTGVYSVGTLARGRERDRRMIPPENVTKLPEGKHTIAQALQQAGYATGMFGKWHLGNDAAHHPAARGFREALVSDGRHFKFKTTPPSTIDEGAYLADFLTDRAVDFIQRHKDRPFFLYLPHFAVHSPLQAKEEWIAHFRDKPAAGGHHHAVYAAMISSLDESVGRVQAALEEAGIADNTLLIFTSDNGGVGGYAVPGSNETKGTTDNAPLRGGKGTLYEGGIRVPFIARWPAMIPKQQQCAAPVAHVDLFPTFVQLAGAAPLSDYPLDGTSFSRLLSHPEQEVQRPAIYWHMPGYLESYIAEDVWRTTPVSVIREGPYKLMEFLEDGRLELYHLGDDLSETKNLAQQEPEVAARLREKLAAWRAATGASMPQKKPAE